MAAKTTRFLRFAVNVLCLLAFTHIVPGSALYVGCYIDVIADRAVPDDSLVVRTSSVTRDLCISHCGDNNRRYAILQFGETCRCGVNGVSYDRHGEVQDSECNTNCAGDSSQTCGGPSRNAVYDLWAELYTFDITATDGDYTVTETEGVLTKSVTVTRTCNNVACPATQNIEIRDTPGSATSGTDYSNVAETVTFTASETSKTFDVQIIGDSNAEICEEDFDLYLFGIDGGAPVPGVLPKTFTIRDNDATTSFVISSADYSIAETDSNVNTELTLTRTCGAGICPCSGQIVQLETRPRSADTSDYVNLAGIPGEVTFTASDNVETVSLMIVGDTLPEIDEDFDVAIQSIGGVATTNSNDAAQTFTIVDDDVMCTIVDNSYAEREVTPAVGQPITVERFGGFTQATDCKIIGKDDTAENTADFDVIEETISFSAKGDPTDSTPQVDTSVEVTIVNDNIYEGPNDEQFYVGLYEIDGETIPENERTYVPFVVMDDDAQIGFETVEYSVLEGEECTCDTATIGVCVTITREGYLQRGATIELTTDRTTFNENEVPADDDDDFVPLTNFEVQFDVDEDSKDICMELVDDKEYESDEVFRVEILNADGLEDIVSIGGEDKSKAAITIRNNDGEICIDSTPEYVVKEGDGGITVYFTRQGYLGREATFTVTTMDGTALVSDNDYTPLVHDTGIGSSTEGQLVTFAIDADRTSVTIPIDASDYDYEDPNEEQFKIWIPDAANQVEDIGSTSDSGPTNTISVSCYEQELAVTDDDAKISIKNSNNGESQPESENAVIEFERIGYDGREQTFRMRTLDRFVDSSSYQAVRGTACSDKDVNCDFDDAGTWISVTFPIGVKVIDRLIDINDDIYQENDEMFGVMISKDPDSPECIDDTRDTIKITIEDDDAFIFIKDFIRDIEVAEYRAYEHEGPIIIQLGREGDLNRAQTVYLRTKEIDQLDGQALSGQDFLDATGTRVTFEEDSATATAEVEFINDEVRELTESFIVTIFNENEDIDPTRDETVVTILDDDAKCTIQAPTPRIVIESVGATDNIPGVSPSLTCFTVWRRGFLGRIGTCKVSTIFNTIDALDYFLLDDDDKTAVAYDDFYPRSSVTVTFPAGVASDNTQFCVNIIDDDDCELPENVYAVIMDQPGTFDKYTQSAYFTIMDDEPESFLFLPPFSWDVVESAGFILINVYRCGDITKEGKVRVRIENGTAVGSQGRRKRQDFDVPLTEGDETILVFPPEVSVMEFNITINDNNLVTGRRSFNIFLEGITGGSLTGSIAGTVNILDDDSFYFIELPYYDVDESDTLVVKVLRNSNYLGNPGTVEISTLSLINAVGGDVSSGAPGLDFEILSNVTVNFDANSESEDVEIPIANDAVSEFSELFIVALSNPDGALYYDIDTAIATINDDDDVYYQFQSTEYRLSESAGEVTVQLERYGSLKDDGRVRVEFKPTDSNGYDAAQSPQDFVATDAWIVFPAGDHTAEASFRVVNDNVREDQETFGIFLTETENGELLYPPRDDATVYIEDDDSNPLITYSMSQTSTSVDESERFVEIHVQRYSSSSYLPPGRAYIGIDEGSARLNQDFAIGDLVAYFGDGETQASVEISIINSPEVESTEIFYVVLEGAEGGNAVLGFPTRTDVTIFDQSVVFSFFGITDAYSVSESQRSLNIRLQRSGNLDNSASVGVVSVSGTATDQDDYDTVNFRATFDRDENVEEFSIYVNIDDDIEGPETFTLVLRDPSSGSIIGENNLVTITIIDSTYREPTEPPPDRSVCYSLGERTYNIDEDDGKVYFTITRSGPGTDEAGRVRFRTDSGSATPGKDYLSKETQIYFPEGNTQQVVYVHILDYDGKEDLEFFTVLLSDPEGSDPSLCGITAATVNIRDVNITEGLALGIIIAIAVAGIVLLLLFMAFLICICFRSPPRERENVIVMKRQRPQPAPAPVQLPQPQSFLIVQPEPEPEPEVEEPEEVVRVIRRVKVPYRVNGPPPPGYPSGQVPYGSAQGPLGGYGFGPSSYPYRQGQPRPAPPPYGVQRAGPPQYRSGLY